MHFSKSLEVSYVILYSYLRTEEADQLEQQEEKEEMQQMEEEEGPF